MLELTIKEKVYSFKFGMGFLREANKTCKREINGFEKNIGFNLIVGSLYDNDVEALVNALLIANKTESPRVTKELLDYYIDEECEDIDDLFKQVADFLSHSNATKKLYKALMDDIKKEVAKAEAKEKAIAERMDEIANK